MADRDMKMNKGDMDELRRLVDGAEGGAWSLDDILAEYSPKAAPIPLQEQEQEQEPAEAPPAPAKKARPKKSRGRRKAEPPPEQMTLEELLGRAAPRRAAEEVPGPAPAEDEAAGQPARDEAREEPPAPAEEAPAQKEAAEAPEPGRKAPEAKGRRTRKKRPAPKREPVSDEPTLRIPTPDEIAAEEERLADGTAAAPEPAAPEPADEPEPPASDEPTLRIPTVDEIAADLIAEQQAQTVPDPTGPRNNVLDFPAAKRRTLAELWQDLARKGDRYADDVMFAEEGMTDDPELRRREELIPGVDKEEAAPPKRRERRPEPPEPDEDPQELARRSAEGLKSLQTRSLLLLPLTLAALYVTLEHLFPLPQLWLLPLDWAMKCWVLAGLLGLGLLLCWDVPVRAAKRLARRRADVELLLGLAALASLADAVCAPFLLVRSELPFCALTLLGLFFAQQGELHRRRGTRLACRTAAAGKEPYLVTLDERKWNGRDTYTKHPGACAGFGSNIQTDDGARRLWRVFCPLLLLGGVLLAELPCLLHGRPELMLWSLAAVLTAACPLAAPLIYARPFHRLARRLSKSGAALAGWPGAVNARRGDGIILTDTDLFPPGSVVLNGIKIFGQRSTDRVVAYTATLIRASGCGLDKLFNDLMRAQGAIYREAQRLCCYEGGGLSADIRGDQVLVGSAAFMKLMDVELPQGLNVKNAVFCAIDGDLAGIFALNYNLPDAAFPAVDSLLREKISPVLATRDFNVIPAMLHQRFRLAAERMDFPPVERRRELSDPEQEHSPDLTAVLCREGLGPFAESVVGARRLRTAVRLNTVLAAVSSVLGLALSAYLTAAGAFASISPLNLLLFLLLWLVPARLITGWADQF